MPIFKEVSVLGKNLILYYVEGVVLDTNTTSTMTGAYTESRGFITTTGDNYANHRTSYIHKTSQTVWIQRTDDRKEQKIYLEHEFDIMPSNKIIIFEVKMYDKNDKYIKTLLQNIYNYSTDRLLGKNINYDGKANNPLDCILSFITFIITSIISLYFADNIKSLSYEGASILVPSIFIISAIISLLVFMKAKNTMYAFESRFREPYKKNDQSSSARKGCVAGRRLIRADCVP